MNNDTTLGELEQKLRVSKVMRLTVSVGNQNIVAMIVTRDGTSILSAGHLTVSAAVSETLARLNSGGRG